MCLAIAIAVVTSPPLSAASWVKVTGSHALSQLMSGLSATVDLPNGQTLCGEYRADGTGTLYAWGAEIPRRWTIEENKHVCITERRERACVRLERSQNDPSVLRAQDITGGPWIEFRFAGENTEQKSAVIEGAGKTVGDKGGAASPSADEVAAELSNPNTALASLNLKNQFRFYGGDLERAAVETFHGSELLHKEARCIWPGVDDQREYRTGGQERACWIVRWCLELAVRLRAYRHPFSGKLFSRKYFVRLTRLRSEVSHERTRSRE